MWYVAPQPYVVPHTAHPGIPLAATLQRCGVLDPGRSLNVLLIRTPEEQSVPHRRTGDSLSPVDNLGKELPIETH